MNPRHLLRRPFCLVVGLLLLPGVGRGADAKPDDKSSVEKLAGTIKAPATAFEVESFLNLDYYSGPDADKVRHKLDVYMPKGAKNVPVVIFIHGGAWRHGSKDFLGIYSKFAKTFARHGIGAVAINYRLSPAVQHPEHIKDVARAFAWTHQNIKKYGGRADQIVVCGHSAGAHLAALLSTDETYLKAEGLGIKNIKAVIPMSAPYRIPEQSPLFNTAFGEDPEIRKSASPLSHVHAGLPPFLVLFADSELPYCGKDSVTAFCNALLDKKCTVASQQMKGRNHMSLITKASNDHDLVFEACQEFILRNCKK